MVRTLTDLSTADAEVARRRRGRSNRTVGLLLRNRLAVAAMLFIAFLVVAALSASLIAPSDPNRQDLLARYQGPSGAHWLGTDSLGRDLLSRLIYGARVSLLAGLIALATSVALGIPPGLLAGYLAGKTESVCNLISDSLLSVPPLILALALIAAIGPGLTNAMVIIGVVISPRFYRLTRAATKDLRAESFVEGSIAIGCSPQRTILVHIFPNVLPPLIVQATFVFGAAILAEASLSFLGLGVRQPTASWGSMLYDATNRLDLTYLVVGPGVALTLTVLAFSALGDGWRDALSVNRSQAQPS